MLHAFSKTEKRFPPQSLYFPGREYRLGNRGRIALVGFLWDVKPHFPSCQLSHTFCQVADGDIRLLVGYVIGLRIFSLKKNMKQSHRTIHHIRPGAKSLTLAFQDDVFPSQYIAHKLSIDTIVGFREVRTINMAWTAIDTSTPYC